MTHYACCKHCRKEFGGMHPMKLNEHISPCPHGCNNAEETAK